MIHVHRSVLDRDGVVQEIVEELRARCHKAALDLALDIGEIVILRLFGSIETWRANTTRDLTLRKLTERPDLPISVATLHRSLSVYELWSQLPPHETNRWRSRIGLTHVRAVLGLPYSNQKKILTDAYEQGWTAERVEAESTNQRRTVCGVRGRPPLPVAIKAARRLRRVAIAENESLLRGVPTFSNNEEREELRAAIDVLKESIRNLQDHLDGPSS